ncbi:MAG: hypothetical protein EOM02_02610 [Synergistales bacterium]|nr:hypothetical protein [Synergistales bacterium]
MENNLEDDVLKDQETADGVSAPVGFLVGLNKLMRFLSWPFRIIWAPKNRAKVVISIMVGSVVVGGFTILRKEMFKNRTTPLGSENFNAMMAITEPPEGKPFFVYVAEKRTVSDVSSDYFSLFPGMPMDSVAVALYPGKNGSILFSSAAFCLDWNSLDPTVRKNVIEVQRGALKDLSFLFDPSTKIGEENPIDQIPIFSLELPGRGKAVFSVYGNALLLSDNREGMIESIRALIHPMTRLSWNNDTSRTVRTFVEDDRRYRFFLHPENSNSGQELPRRSHQALSSSLLLNIGIRQADPEGLSEEFLLWLTRKEGNPSNDTSFAFDNAFVNAMAYLCLAPSRN